MEYRTKEKRDKKGRFVKGSQINLGHKHSQETIEKIRKANIGKKPWCTGKKLSKEHIEKLKISHIGQKAWNKGEKNKAITGEKHYNWKGGKDRFPNCKICDKKLTVLRANFCIQHVPRSFVPISLRGEFSHNWKGGVAHINQKDRSLQKNVDWRRGVFKRDKFTCQKYGTIGHKLVAHHVYNFVDFPELRFELENGITLSEKAHKEFHSQYGNRKTTREQLKEFLLKK